MFGGNKMNPRRRSGVQGQPAPNQQPNNPPVPTPPAPARQVANQVNWSWVTNNGKMIAMALTAIIGLALILGVRHLINGDQTVRMVYAAGLFIVTLLVCYASGLSAKGAIPWLIAGIVVATILLAMDKSPAEIGKDVLGAGSKAVGSINPFANPKWEKIRDIVVRVEPGQRIGTGITVEKGDRVDFLFGNNSCSFKLKNGDGTFRVIAPSATKREHSMVIDNFGELFVYGHDQSGIIRVVVRRPA